ncbi:MAG: DegQ family serine endoprotease [Balneolales bacterium]|nr:DegQ family serine endoprotease [Balneolales bacterium]
MHTITPKFAAAFTFALLVLFVSYFSNRPAEPANNTYVYSEEASAQVQQHATDRPIRSLRDLNDAFVSLAENAAPAVVTVNTERTVRQRQMSPFDMFDEFFGRPRQQPRERSFQQRGQGSGVIVSADGIIMTNHHVIANADTIIVRLSNNDNIGATIIGTDPSTDIAILRVDARNLPFMPMGDSDALRVGEWVMAIGSPLSQNLAQTVTQGIVSAKGRSNVNLVDFEDFIQTDAAINPGNSGGPLMNMDGELIGINTAIASRSGGFQGIGFAVPINMARAVMDSILETGRVVRGFIGITGQELDDSLARAFGLDRTKGAVITDVSEGSPAEQAGLRVEDIIVEYDGRTLTNWRTFQSYVASRAPGAQIRLVVNREGETINMTVTLGERPDEDLTEEEVESMFERFGFSIDTFSESQAERHNLRADLSGVIVTAVQEGSVAHRRGLREGDLITAVNRRRVTNPQEFSNLVQNVQPGSTLLMNVVRQNQQFFISIDV